MKLTLSPLGHSWFLDLDGTILKHNGYKLDGTDSLLSGALDFLSQIPPEDSIIFVTSRKESEKQRTEDFLRNHQIPFQTILYNLPYGERILVNDRKPSGLETAQVISVERNQAPKVEITISEDL